MMVFAAVIAGLVVGGIVAAALNGIDDTLRRIAGALDALEERNRKP